MSIYISRFQMSMDEEARKKQVLLNQRMVEQSLLELRQVDV